MYLKRVKNYVICQLCLKLLIKNSVSTQVDASQHRRQFQMCRGSSTESMVLLKTHFSSGVSCSGQNPPLVHRWFMLYLSS